MTTTTAFPLSRALGIAGPLFLALGVAVPAAAQQDGRWTAWLGCWQPTADPTVADVPAEAEPYVVCVTAAEGGARFATVSGGETVAERTVVANGTQRPVEQSGCQGWETARWSQDEQRVYLRSELTCEGGTQRTTTGVLSMASPEEWIDVQGVAAGDNEAVRARRYRVASEARVRAAGAAVDVADRSLALSTARTAAAQELSLEDVKEATTQVSAPVVEALLVERQSQIRVDAKALVSLADAGVPESVIDLMVAQANPDRFMIDRAARAGVEVPAEETEERDRRYPIYAGWGYDPFGYDPFWYGSYGRYGYSRYGYGYRDPYSWNYGRGPSIIIINPGTDDDDQPRRSGRMVKGRGYVPTDGATRSGGDSSVRSSGGSGSSGATAGSGSSSGGSSSGSSKGRKATRRGGGGGL
jgi:hypothetical protein